MNIDGIVVNIYQENGYLENRDNWANFEIAMKEAVRLGFRIWLYDENGYPSGGAGGIVLRDRPEREAKGIKFHEGRYFISNIYEGSHAERNFRPRIEGIGPAPQRRPCLGRARGHDARHHLDLADAQPVVGVHHPHPGAGGAAAVRPHLACEAHLYRGTDEFDVEPVGIHLQLFVEAQRFLGDFG